MSLLSAAGGWIAGASGRANRSRTRGLLESVIFAACAGWFFLVGPGVLFEPFSSVRFRTLRDGTVAVYYRDVDERSARDALSAVKRAEASLLQFWGAPPGEPFPGSVRVYLCGSPAMYRLITGNAALGSALWNGPVVLNYSRETARADPGASLCHELSHIYLRRIHGWPRLRGRIPAWFDEGCAGIACPMAFASSARLSAALERSPDLIPIATLESAFDWHSGLARGSAVKQYGHVRSFVSFLEERFGHEAVIRYPAFATAGGASGGAFERAFGMTIADAERAWLEDRIEAGMIPGDTRFSRLRASPAVAVKWTVAACAFVFLLLWTVRQACRAARAAASSRTVRRPATG